MLFCVAFGALLSCPFCFVEVVESQARKKIEQLKELLCEAQDVYTQMVATKAQITGRMMECFNALQKIQDSLLTLSGPDVTTVLSKLKVSANFHYVFLVASQTIDAIRINRLNQIRHAKLYLRFF